MIDLQTNIQHKTNLTKFDKEILEEIKFNSLKECMDPNNDTENIFKLTVNKLIEKNPNLEDIILEELATQLFEHNHFNKYISNFHWLDIANKIMKNSKTYDIILFFENGKQIKTHTQLLKFVGCFKFITDYPTENTGESPRIEKVSFDYENIKFVINHLYVAYYDIDTNKYIDYILILDSVDIQDHQELFFKLCSMCVAYFTDSIIYCFKNNNFEDFLRKLDLLLDIFKNIKGKVFIYDFKCVEIFFTCHKASYDDQILIESPLFIKKLLKTNFGYKLIIENKLFHLIEQIITDDNYYELLESVITENPKNLFDILKVFGTQTTKFNSYTKLINKLPIEIFRHPLYDTLLNRHKMSLILKHKQYDYLNVLKPYTSDDLIKLANLLLDTEDSEKWKNLLSLQKMKKSVLFYKQKIDITKYNNFTHIESLYPLSFKSYMYIGNVLEIINGDNTKIGIRIEIATYNLNLNIGQTIIVANNCDDNISNYTFTITKMYPYLMNNVQLSNNNLLLCKNYPVIDIIFENFNSHEILNNTTVFCEN